MRFMLLPLVLAQAEPADLTATTAGQKLSEFWTDFREQVLQADTAQEVTHNLGALLWDYGIPLVMHLLIAIAVFVVGRWIAQVVRRVIAKLLVRAKVDVTLQKFLCNVLYALLIVAVVMAALSQLGIDTTSFAAILAAAGFAIGFALKGSLGKFAAGVMLILFKPFAVGDFVEIAGVKGTVEEIHLFNTFLRSADNIQIIVPNDSIIDSTITNYSAKETRRIDLVVRCGYGDNLKEVKQFLVDLLAADPRVLKEPEPSVAVSDLAESSVNFVVRPWVKREDYWSTHCDLTEAIKNGFDARGFKIPFSTQELLVQTVGATEN